MALVVWSGGCDSTLILNDLLVAGRDDVRTVAINHKQVGNNPESKAARQKIIKHFAKKKITWEHEEVEIDTYGGHQNGGTIQPCIWLLNATCNLKANEDLYMGYIRGDDVWHYMEQVRSIFNNIQYMTHKTGRLQLPLEWERKKDIKKRLNQTGLLNLVWWCESPVKGKPCNKCCSCKVHFQK